MKILGRIILTNAQARSISPGGSLDVPSQQFREFIRARARIGDLIWCQEEFSLYEPKNIFATNYGVLVGPVGRQRNKLPRNCDPARSVRHRHEARYLKRTDSCVTLEIMGVVGQAVRCLVHYAQIDEFVKAMAQ